MTSIDSDTMLTITGVLLAVHLATHALKFQAFIAAPACLASLSQTSARTISRGKCLACHRYFTDKVSLGCFRVLSAVVFTSPVPIGMEYVYNLKRYDGVSNFGHCTYG